MKETYKLKYHLEPASGWMNDPNGLVEKDEHIISIINMPMKQKVDLNTGNNSQLKISFTTRMRALPSLLIILMIRVVYILDAVLMIMGYYVISIRVM